MLYRNLSILFCFSIIALSCNGQLIYQKGFIIGTSASSYGIIETSDSCYLIHGVAKAPTDAYNKGFILKIDSLGNSMWAVKLGSPTSDDATTKIIEKNGFVYALTSTSYNFKQCVMITKLNLANGSKVWSKFYGLPPNKNGGYDIMFLPDKKILICGYYDRKLQLAPGGDTCQTFLLKIDTAGTLITCKNFATAFYLILGRVLINENNQIILHGAYRDSAYSKYDLIFAVLDSELNIAVSYKYKSSGIDLYANTLKKTDGGYLVGGSIEQNFIMKGFLIQFDSLFNVVWSRDYSSTSPYFFLDDFVVKNDKTILSAGGLSVVSLLDSSGNTIWSRKTSIPGSSNSIYTGILITQDNGFFVVGSSGPSSLILIQKADSDANMGCNNYNNNLTSSPFTTIVQPVVLDTIAMTVTVYPDTNNFNITLDSIIYCYTATTIDENFQSGVNIFPNPFKDNFEIIQADVVQNILCVLTDCYGNIRAKWQVSNGNYKFDSNHLPPGFYVLNLLNDKGSYSRSIKLIKL